MTSKVRCKVRCTRVGEANYYPGQESQYEAEFTAVSNGSEENKQFFKYTPSLSLKTGIISTQHFEAGKEYYLDFTPAN